SDHVWLDLTHLDAARVEAHFPNIARVCRRYGIEITQQPIPVAPAAHYMIGGIRTDVWGRTSLPGLYACGEASSTGVHGANRLASNSLLEAVVFARRIVEASGADGSGQVDKWPGGQVGEENPRPLPKESADSGSPAVEVETLRALPVDGRGAATVPRLRG